MKKTNAIKSTAVGAAVVGAAVITTVGVSSASAHSKGFHEKPTLTAEQQQVVEQIHELKEQGQFEEARALALESNLPLRHGFRRGPAHQAVRDAIENDDYAAFLDATADRPFPVDIDEATFDSLVEAHLLREAGEFEEAKGILDSLGLKPHGHHKFAHP